MDQGTIHACNIFCYSELLAGAMNLEFLKTLTLKGVAYIVGLTQRKVRSMTVDKVRSVRKTWSYQHLWNKK